MDFQDRHDSSIEIQINESVLAKNRSYKIKGNSSAEYDNKVIEIKNDSNQTVNFNLGFNNMLFPDKISLINYIQKGDVYSKIENGNEYDLKPFIDLYGYADINQNIDQDFFRAFLFLVPRVYHFPELTDILGQTSWAESPMLVINSFGFGTCITHARVISNIWQTLGYCTRERFLNGHTVSEVLDGQRWLLYDCDKNVYYFDEQNNVVGIDDLKQDSSIIDPNWRFVIYDTPDYEFPQSDAGISVKNVIDNSYGPWLVPKETIPIPDDWAPLNITLPSYSKFSFPYDGNEIFFPEFYPLAVYYGDHVLSPKYKYAVLEMDSGVTGMISVGLYPYKIDGQCLIYIVGMGYMLGTDFNQVTKTRSERYYASTITIVNSSSPVKIYYLLTNYTQLLRSNKLVLKNLSSHRVLVSLQDKEVMF